MEDSARLVVLKQGISEGLHVQLTRHGKDQSLRMFENTFAAPTNGGSCCFNIAWDKVNSVDDLAETQYISIILLEASTLAAKGIEVMLFPILAFTIRTLILNTSKSATRSNASTKS